MHRLDTSTAVAVKPAAETAGDPGFFTKGDPVGGLPASVPGPDWFNMVQEELIAILEALGGTPDQTKSNYGQIATQLLEAISKTRHGIDPASRVSNVLYTNSTGKIMTVTAHFTGPGTYHAFLSVGGSAVNAGEYISNYLYGSRASLDVLPGETYQWSYNSGLSVPILAYWEETH